MARPKKSVAEIEAPEIQSEDTVDSIEEDRFELDTFPVKVHGRTVEVWETEEELVDGVCVQIVLKTIEGCTYQGIRVEDGVLVQ